MGLEVLTYSLGISLSPSLTENSSASPHILPTVLFAYLFHILESLISYSLLVHFIPLGILTFLKLLEHLESIPHN